MNVPGWQFWETAEEEPIPEEVVEEEPKITNSWIPCGGKSLLEEPVLESEFGTKSDPCTLADGESPFSIMIYRSLEDYKSRMGDKRPLFVDELEQNPELKAKALEFLVGQTSNRGISETTKYGLVNGWADSTQIVQNCGSIQTTGPITKVLGTKACFPIFEIQNYI